MAVGEALAAGTPCVVVNAGGAPESVREGEDGFVVEDDPAALAARALELLGDPALRRRLSERARLYAAERTPEKVAGRVIGVYEAALASRRADTEAYRRRRR